MSVSRTCFDGLSVGYFGGWAVNPVDRSKSPTNVVAVAAIFKEKKIFRLTIAPHWSFVVSDMYNYDYNPEKTKKANNYPSVLVFYTKHSNRFSIGYIKQVEGIVCTGGICRYEPAFSGIKATISTTF